MFIRPEPLPELPHPINPSSFRASDGIALESITTEGGLPSTRLDVVNARGKASVQWIMSAQSYKGFTDFYFDTIQEGAKPFLMRLAFDYATPHLNEVRLIPGTLGLESLDGHKVRVSGEIEIVPAYSADDDLLIVSLFEQYTIEELNLIFASLHDFVNVEAPKWIDA